MDYDRDREVFVDRQPLIQQPPVTIDAKPGGELRQLQQIPNALWNPIGAALEMLITYAEKNAQEREAGRKLIEAFLEHQKQGQRATGFGSQRINYRPAAPENRNGVMVVDLSTMNRSRVEFFSLVTFPFAAGDGSPNANVIYGSFGRSLFTSDSTVAPENFDFGLNVGGKIEKYNVRQGLEAFSLWSKTAFDAVIYVTPGTADQLPDL